ncbi:MaoC/PaaZ C-terminal domain-containing protein [Streptomyces sp. KR55]|uniref:MaoC/PaaZ C-terminal domain-containing protein n=1 Tax=Streptomyces sp. KR55 TaxID=3457425 RepID=UPI003FD35944
MKPGETFDLSVTPDRDLPHRYARASKDFNPIHIDEEFARGVGLPSNILHGLYTMGIAARAVLTAAGGDPRALRRIAVQFRDFGVPEQEIVVRGTASDTDGDEIVVDLVADQNGRPLIRGGEAVTRL